MGNCPICGETMQDDARFCTKCGKPFDTENKNVSGDVYLNIIKKAATSKLFLTALILLTINVFAEMIRYLYILFVDTDFLNLKDIFISAKNLTFPLISFLFILIAASSIKTAFYLFYFLILFTAHNFGGNDFTTYFIVSMQKNSLPAFTNFIFEMIFCILTAAAYFLFAILFIHYKKSTDKIYDIINQC